MDEWALERYFDKYIAHDSSRINEEHDEGEEAFFRLLPDELLTLPESGQNNTAENQSRTVGPSLDHNSQNASAGPSSATPQCHKPLLRPCIRPLLSWFRVFASRNVVSVVNLGCRLDLDLIARTAWNVVYSAQVSHMLTMRIRKPRTTANIFYTGKLVCTGATSMEESKVAARRFARIVQKLGFPVRFLNFRIQMIVATCDTFPVSLENLVRAHKEHCCYDPELFSCVFYKLQPGQRIIIPWTGRLTLTGPKNMEDIYRGFETIYPILCNFRIRIRGGS
ncbi:TATA-box-binding protein-like [Stegastes partitus]|uniref:TATA-box-binding protein-like n=1 Tax=Stegastes partitus TaxID=144197 RepID=A0A9Y4NBQ8_9TELE|nr:PREDICTED: TATA-box-binding protein-like [Stegastes partitus]